MRTLVSFNAYTQSITRTYPAESPQRLDPWCFNVVGRWGYGSLPQIIPARKRLRVKGIVGLVLSFSPSCRSSKGLRSPTHKDSQLKIIIVTTEERSSWTEATRRGACQVRSRRYSDVVEGIKQRNGLENHVRSLALQLTIMSRQGM